MAFRANLRTDVELTVTVEKIGLIPKLGRGGRRTVEISVAGKRVTACEGEDVVFHREFRSDKLG